MTREEVEKELPIGTEVWVKARIQGVFDPLSPPREGAPVPAHLGEVVICVEFEHPDVGPARHVLGDPTFEETIFSNVRKVVTADVPAGGAQSSRQSNAARLEAFIAEVAQEFDGELPGDAWHLYFHRGMTPKEAAERHRATAADLERERIAQGGVA